jgi:hypothetical protein
VSDVTAPEERCASSVVQVLIAEELLLLSLDEESGRSRLGRDRLEPALAGALLAELALLERIGVTAPGSGWSAWKPRRVTVTDLTPTDDVELDRTLEAVAAAEGRPVKDLVSAGSSRRLSKGLRDRLLERLVTAGVLDERAGRILGFIPRTTWPTRDRSAEDEVRRRLHAALVAGLTPTERTVALVGLLQVTGALTRVLEVEDRKALKARATALTAGDWVARAVKQAIDEVSSTGATAGGGSA